MEWTHEWYWRKLEGDRKGTPCRVLARSLRLNSVLVEFPDGYRVITSAWAVREIGT